MSVPIMSPDSPGILKITDFDAFSSEMMQTGLIIMSPDSPGILKITDFDAFSSEMMQTGLIMGTDIYRRTWGAKKLSTKPALRLR